MSLISFSVYYNGSQLLLSPAFISHPGILPMASERIAHNGGGMLAK